MENTLGGPTGLGAEQGSLDVWALGSDPLNPDAAWLTLGFDVVLRNGPGPDLIVFENGFFQGAAPDQFLGELAFVEVSTDGAAFARFPARTTSTEPVGPFGLIDPDAYENLAGNRPTFANVELSPVDPLPFDAAAAGGTAFDFDDLTTHPLVVSGVVDLDRIRQVRIVDIHGDGSVLDAYGNTIYDPTGIGNAADIDAAAAIHFHEETPRPWSQFAGSSSGGGRQFIPATVTALTSPTWTTAEGGLAPTGSMVLMPGDPDRVIAWGPDGEESLRVSAFDARTGARPWQTAPLADGFALDFESWSTACADPATSRVLFACGGLAYGFDAEDGREVWRTALDAGGSAEVVNGSFHVLDGTAFISTYGGFTPNQKRLYAIRVADGQVLWSQQDGGSGSESPAVIPARDGQTSRVVTLTAQGMACYRAANGAALWTSAAPLGGAESWQTAHGFFGGLTAAEGVVLASTYSFREEAELVCVDARTGRLLWRNPNALNSDGTPTVAGGAVFVAGEEEFSRSYVAAYALSTGEELWKTQITEDGSLWRLSTVATEDALYVTGGEASAEDGGGLYRLDLATGAVRSRSPVLHSGTPAIAPDGALYVFTPGGRLSAYLPPSQPLTPPTGWFFYE
ncbi:MAG: PQQ-binding-like beta-propeller repeat protein [Sumerlaeia bacterium]